MKLRIRNYVDIFCKKNKKRMYEKKNKLKKIRKILFFNYLFKSKASN